MSSFSALIVSGGIHCGEVVYDEAEHCNLLTYYWG
jgi:hypothetical protein